MCSAYSWNHTQIVGKGKGKVFYRQEPPSVESTTTQCMVSIINYLQ